MKLRSLKLRSALLALTLITMAPGLTLANKQAKAPRTAAQKNDLDAFASVCNFVLKNSPTFLKEKMRLSLSEQFHSRVESLLEEELTETEDSWRESELATARRFYRSQGKRHIPAEVRRRIAAAPFVSPIDAAIQELKKSLTESSFESLMKYYDKDAPVDAPSQGSADSKFVVTKRDIAMIYTHLANWQRVMGSEQDSAEDNSLPTGVELEVRVEKWKGYILLPLKYSFYGESFKKVTLLHTRSWAEKRFINESTDASAPSEFGLLGQFMGSSKFFLAADLPTGMTREKALSDLGLKGNKFFDNGEDVFIVRVPLGGKGKNKAALKEALNPKIAVVFKNRDEENGLSSWKADPWFIKGSLPGYTSGGYAEVVTNTIQLPAKTKAELEQLGISVELLRNE